MTYLDDALATLRRFSLRVDHDETTHLCCESCGRDWTLGQAPSVAEVVYAALGHATAAHDG